MHVIHVLFVLTKLEEIAWRCLTIVLQTFCSKARVASLLLARNNEVHVCFQCTACVLSFVLVKRILFASWFEFCLLLYRVWRVANVNTMRVWAYVTCSDGVRRHSHVILLLIISLFNQRASCNCLCWLCFYRLPHLFLPTFSVGIAHLYWRDVKLVRSIIVSFLYVLHCTIRSLFCNECLQFALFFLSYSKPFFFDELIEQVFVLRNGKWRKAWFQTMSRDIKVDTRLTEHSDSETDQN